MRRTLRRLADGWIRIGEGLAALAGFFLIALAIPIAFDVVARKFGHPTIWAFDTSLYLMVAVVYVGIADGIRSGTHFRVHLLLDRLHGQNPHGTVDQARTLVPPGYPERRLRLRGIRGGDLDVLDLALVFAFGVILAWAGGDLAWTSYTTHATSTTLLQVPLFVPQLMLPLAGVSLALEALALLARRYTGEGEPA